MREKLCPDHAKPQSPGGSMSPHSVSSSIESIRSARRRPKNASHRSFGLTRAQVRQPPRGKEQVVRVGRGVLGSIAPRAHLGGTDAHSRVREEQSAFRDEPGWFSTRSKPRISNSEQGRAGDHSEVSWLHTSAGQLHRGCPSRNRHDVRSSTTPWVAVASGVACGRGFD